MKTSIAKFGFFLAAAILIVACSTKRNTFISRNSHALSTEYNILYNGGIALDAGVKELTLNQDNFWELLPIERMQPKPEALAAGQTPNANFERAETKAIKAIQKHSMNIGGSEKNPQMDEAHLMLGKARYYDNRFVPALEAFNYILYKYPTSDKIYEAKVWREKTNIRLENDQVAVNNLRKLLSEIKFKDQIFADANAMLAQAFLNLEEKDSAVSKIKLAADFTEKNEEKARYRFILGQLYEQQGFKDSAYAAYQSVIDMNRKSPRQYVINAHARQASQFDFKGGDTLAFMKKYQKLLDDRENRPFLAELNHQVALFYDQRKQYKPAMKYYNASLRKRNDNVYLAASNYRNLAEIYFDNANYVAAGQYYDSTLVELNPRSREHKAITRKRENLVDVIKYEGIAKANDSILKLAIMSEADRTAFFEAHIGKLKKAEEARRIREEKAAKEAIASGRAPEGRGGENSAVSEEAAPGGRGVSGKTGAANPTPALNPGPTPGGQASSFYFYNPTTVAYGKNEFRKNWGDRALVKNWRISSAQSNTALAAGGRNAAGENDASAGDLASATEDERYSTEFYTSRIPTSQTVLDSIAKERNFAYYQLGIIYKEKFKEYERAADKLEKLLKNSPEERLVLPSMYNLYKIYEIINAAKAEEMKQRIIGQYPDSRYAQILSNSNSESLANLAPETAYDNLYKEYLAGDYIQVLARLDNAIEQYTGDEISPKLELLKAHTIGKLRGLDEYQKALNFVALNFPNSQEGKQAEALIAKEIPALASLQFSSSETTNWKILYRANDLGSKGVKSLQEKIKKFLADRQLGKLSMSTDLYTETENFVVIHGSTSEDYAKGIASILKEFKEYKVPDQPIIISGQNYEVIQIKKNLNAYLTDPAFIPISVTNQLPFTPPAREQAPAQPAKQQVRQQAKTQAQNQAPGNQTPGSNLNQNQQSKNPGKTTSQPQQFQPPGQMGQQPGNPGMPPSMQPPKR